MKKVLKGLQGLIARAAKRLSPSSTQAAMGVSSLAPRYEVTVVAPHIERSGSGTNYFFSKPKVTTSEPLTKFYTEDTSGPIYSLTADGQWWKEEYNPQRVNINTIPEYRAYQKRIARKEDGGLVERFKRGKKVRRKRSSVRTTSSLPNIIFLKGRELGWTDEMITNTLNEAKKRGWYKEGDEYNPGFWKGVAALGLQLGYTSAALSLRNNISSKNINVSTTPTNKNDIAALQQKLWDAGAFNGVTNSRGKQITYRQAVDGKMGRMTRQAMNNLKTSNSSTHGHVRIPKSEASSTPNKGLISNFPIVQRFNETMDKLRQNPQVNQALKYLDEIKDNKRKVVTNMLRNPVQGLIDGVLYAGDLAGLPTNATNYLRDLNVSIPQRLGALPFAAAESLFGNKTFSDAYRDQLANPNLITDLTTIEPLTNTNANYTDKQMDIIREMAGDKSYIDNADIKRVAGGYGKEGGIRGYLGDDYKIVQTSIGQTSGRDGFLSDVFDVNTQSDVAKHDNAMYSNMDNGIGSYSGLRASMPYTSSIDIMPDKHKIKTILYVGDNRK